MKDYLTTVERVVVLAMIVFSFVGICDVLIRKAGWWQVTLGLYSIILLFGIGFYFLLTKDKHNNR